MTAFRVFKRRFGAISRQSGLRRDLLPVNHIE
jgi:hypothetical protein